MAGIDIVHVPHKAGDTVVTDFLSNRVSVYFPPVVQIVPMINSRTVNAYSRYKIRALPLWRRS